MYLDLNPTCGVEDQLKLDIDLYLKYTLTLFIQKNLDL